MTPRWPRNRATRTRCRRHARRDGAGPWRRDGVEMASRWRPPSPRWRRDGAGIALALRHTKQRAGRQTRQRRPADAEDQQEHRPAVVAESRAASETPGRRPARMASNLRGAAMRCDSAGSRDDDRPVISSHRRGGRLLCAALRLLNTPPAALLRRRRLAINNCRHRRRQPNRDRRAVRRGAEPRRGPTGALGVDLRELHWLAFHIKEKHVDGVESPRSEQTQLRRQHRV